LIEKLKKQLFNPSFLFVAIIFSVLIGLFIVAIFYINSFFIYIDISLIICLIYIIPLRSRLIKKESQVNLRVQDIQEHSNLLEAEINYEKIAIESLRDKIVNSSQLKGLTEQLSMCLSLEDTSKTLSAEVNKLFGDKETTIILYLFHSKTGELGISSSKKGQMSINIKSKKGDLFDQWIVKTMQPLLIEDTRKDYRFDIEKIITEDFRSIRSLISVPLIVGNKALGILRIDSPMENTFSTEDLRFLATIADLGAVAIENAQLYEKVEQLALRDGLTDLYLKRYLLERMPEEVSRQVRRGSQLSFLMFDLDKFKEYNDKFGHVAGDIALRSIAMILADFFKEPGNLVCRYGGEEFSVLLPDCPKERALELADAVRKKIESQTIILRREKTHITVSIGVATFPNDAKTKEELIHKADMALYTAKNSGRNKVCSAR